MIFRIRTETDRSMAIREIVNRKMPCKVEVSDAGRSLDANALSHVWYGAIGRQDPEHNTTTARRFAKLHFGVPIMREDEKFRDAWDRMLRALPYETKLELMDWWPVTSLMDRGQMSRYLDAMQKHWAPRGVLLTGLDRGESLYPEAAA